MTFDKIKTFKTADKYKDFNKEEKELMMKTMEQIWDFLMKKVSIDDFEAFLMLIPMEIQDAAFDIMGAMYPDRISPKERFILAGKIKDKLCDKCGGHGNFCTGMKTSNGKLFSICGLCQMEIVK